MNPSDNSVCIYPEVYVRLRLVLTKPALPTQETYMDIWTRGPRFHVRDESGRDIAAILDDVTAARGLGADPHSMEEIMDRWTQSRNAVSRVTDVYGDLETAKGVVQRTGQVPWSMAAEILAPLADQIFARKKNARLELKRQTVLLNRSAVEYHGILRGKDQGVPYKSEVTRIVSPLYLLVERVHDSKNPDHSLIREIVSLQEGKVDDRDLAPPEIP